MTNPLSPAACHHAGNQQITVLGPIPEFGKLILMNIQDVTDCTALGDTVTFNRNSDIFLRLMT